MRSLVVAGLCVDSVGAILLVLGAVFVSPGEIVSRHVTFPSSMESAAPRIRKDAWMLRAARAGATLLLVGFALQLAGQLA